MKFSVFYLTALLSPAVTIFTISALTSSARAEVALKKNTHHSALTNTVKTQSNHQPTTSPGVSTDSVASVTAGGTTPTTKAAISTAAVQYIHPDHLVMMVFDAMRPDYIDRFNMTQFKRLRRLSTEYNHAMVGYIGAETVVAHLVIPTGLPPKDLPWHDDIFKDQKGLLGDAGDFYATGELEASQLQTLMRTIPAEKYLQHRLKQKYGGKVFAVGSKGYAAHIFGGPYADSVITIKKDGGTCTPTGTNVPAYITASDRFNLDCSAKFGSEGSWYPADTRYLPGHDQTHLGGDAWVADAALEIMAHDADWRGLFLTFPSIDKISHMMGDHDGPRPHSFKFEYDLTAILKVADQQLGRILDDLEKRDLLRRTVIVVTADHGGQGNDHYLGMGTGKSAVGGYENDSSHSDEPPPFWISHFFKTDRVRLSYQDSAIRTWLKPPPQDQDDRDDRDSANHIEKSTPGTGAGTKLSTKPGPLNGTTNPDAKLVVQKMSEVSGITEIYGLEKSATAMTTLSTTLGSTPGTVSSNGWVYKRVFSALQKQPPAFQAWANAHSQEILNALACESAPHIVGLLADGVGFGLLGDHGGAQEKVQRVPLMIYRRGMNARKSSEPIRLYEIEPLVSDMMELR